MPDSYLKEPEKTPRRPEGQPMTVVSSHALKKVDEAVRNRLKTIKGKIFTVF